jgi:Mn2+/Fe2+ NRAMP family transporter
MIKTIAQIASVVSALAAVTTSLRALGKSREYFQQGHHVVHKKLSSYLAVTIVWFILSIIFIIPTLIHRWANERNILLFPWVFLFLLLSLVLWLIWRRIPIFKVESSK